MMNYVTRNTAKPVCTAVCHDDTIHFVVLRTTIVDCDLSRCGHVLFQRKILQTGSNGLLIYRIKARDRD